MSFPASETKGLLQKEILEPRDHHQWHDFMPIVNRIQGMCAMIVQRRIRTSPSWRSHYLPWDTFSPGSPQRSNLARFKSRLCAASWARFRFTLDAIDCKTPLKRKHLENHHSSALSLPRICCWSCIFSWIISVLHLVLHLYIFSFVNNWAQTFDHFIDRPLVVFRVLKDTFSRFVSLILDPLNILLHECPLCRQTTSRTNNTFDPIIRESSSFQCFASQFLPKLLFRPWKRFERWSLNPWVQRNVSSSHLFLKIQMHRR